MVGFGRITIIIFRDRDLTSDSKVKHMHILDKVFIFLFYSMYIISPHRRFRSISLKVLVRLSSNFAHNTPRGSSCAFWGIWTLTYFWFRTMTYLDVWRALIFRSRSRKVLGPWQSYCTCMFSKVPSCAFSGFWTLTLKLTQHFDLIYNIGKSDWKILRNIMKTAQDS